MIWYARMTSPLTSRKIENGESLQVWQMTDRVAPLSKPALTGFEFLDRGPVAGTANLRAVLESWTQESLVQKRKEVGFVVGELLEDVVSFLVNLSDDTI
jgi:hypothetical protein